METLEILSWSFQQNYHLDKSNACIHCAPVRFSPITFRLCQVLLVIWPENEDITSELAEVRDHLNKYEEDKGR